LALLIGVSVLLVIGIAAGPNDTVTAKAFIVKGDNGKGRASIAVNDSNGVAFNVFSPEGEIKASLGTSGKGEPFLVLYSHKDGKLKSRAYMSVTDDEPHLALVDKDGETVFNAMRQP
jgi:hypothetical protein